jgi:hypothetical protein
MLRPRRDYVMMRKHVIRIEKLTQKKYVLHICTLHIVFEWLNQRACHGWGMYYTPRRRKVFTKFWFEYLKVGGHFKNLTQIGR